ncbi:MAG: hypothetical protein QG641_315, partial [Candidatus Poribacteria bacterium]|nr:hypothetical protein [Candidatus Poribacteria bacterium]
FMPDGTTFSFWNDVTEYKHVYHVNSQHPNASDDGTGTEDQPFATIGRAVKELKPVEKVIVHGGIYRECIRPARGGEAPDRMIAYEVAPGEEVFVRGSQIWKTKFKPSDGWNFRNQAKVWMGELPEEWFIGYNPFMTQNFSSEYTTFTRDWTDAEITCFMLKRGMIFANGRPLKQVFRHHELADTDGAFWVEEPGLKIHLRLWNDADPNESTIEVTTKEQIFAPKEQGLGYIRVSGFHFEHSADGIPVPQRAMVSASRGHHWIIEDCSIRWANACGIDVGNETWHRPYQDNPELTGHHIIRRNHVSDCGVCGIEAVGNNAHSLVEDNVVERIGDKNIERIWETGGLKFHTCDTVLIRRNVFRHIRHAPGLWLDYLNKNCRVTGNVFTDIEGILGGVYIEVSHAPNAVDHNIFWNIRGTGQSRGPGVNVDTGEECIVAHNLFGKIKDGYAVSVSLNQRTRVVGGRVGLCRQHKVMNNIFVECPKRILFSRVEDNQSNGNLFDQRNDSVSLCIEYPEPQALVNISAWQRYYGLDKNSTQAKIEADFDPETLVLTMIVDGEMPDCKPMTELHDENAVSPGPVEIKSGRQEYEISK